MFAALLAVNSKGIKVGGTGTVVFAFCHMLMMVGEAEGGDPARATNEYTSHGPVVDKLRDFLDGTRARPFLSAALTS